ncbi:MAG: LamG domain-containing protein [Verrucomicrobia bacterium]|nr:LamG domain-containing protein [Verrucomicrobiota bacterium]
MKKSRSSLRILLAGTVALTCAFPALSQTTLPAVTGGLVAYYPFNGSAADASGNGNNGTVYGAVFESAGIAGTPCLRFNGTSSTYVSVPRNTTLEPTEALSIALWCKGTSGGPDQFGTIVRKAANMAPGFFIRSRPPNHGYTDLRLRFETFAPGIDVPFADYLGDEWTHLAVTFSRQQGEVRTFMNGREVYRTTLTEPLQHTDNLYIGGAPVHWMDGGFKGLLDDVCIYNRALTPAEIQQLYDPLTPDIAWWPMVNRGTGRVEDVTGRGHTAVIAGQPAFGFAPEIGQNYIQFNGVDTWLRVEDANDLDLLGNWTIAFWSRPGQLFNGLEFVIDKGCANVAGGYSVVVGNRAELAIVTTGGVGGAYVLGGGTTPVNVWTHVSVTFNSATSEARIFVNGDLVANRVLGPVRNSANYLLLGASKDYGCVVNPGYRSKGAVADVRIYGRELSLEAIRVLMGQKVGPFLVLKPAVVWERAGTDGYLLEGAASATGPWREVTAPKWVAGTQTMVLQEPFSASAMRFFRLRKP